ncbi:MAG TPA: aldo/keto reductase, partial [Acidimicrobiia bacterium]|nr:aldo/keto reductase [Acidimicrobiia bacterium]
TRIIHRALDAGINFVDTADVYAGGESEEIVGAALGGRRDSVILGTKFHNPMGDSFNRRGNSRRWIVQAVEESLRRLRTEWIDIYQVHRPDPATAIADTVDALSDLVRAGKIRYWGTSMFPPGQIVDALWVSDRRGAIPPRSEQVLYNVFARNPETDLFPTCRRHGTAVITWSPLSGGWLTGKYTREHPAPRGSRAERFPQYFDAANEVKLGMVERLTAVAADAGIPLTHLALAWCGEHPAVSTTLLGPRTEAQLEDLLRVGDTRLDAATLDRIDEINPPGVLLNPHDQDWANPDLAPAARRRP